MDGDEVTVFVKCLVCEKVESMPFPDFADLALTPAGLKWICSCGNRNGENTLTWCEE